MVHIASLELALKTIPGLMAKGDVVLVKGSRAAGLERLVNRLVETLGSSWIGSEETRETEQFIAGAGRRSESG